MKQPITPRALGVFFTIAEFLTFVVSITLLMPDTPLDEIWAIKPAAHEDLLLLRPLSTAGFIVLTIAMGFAAAGCFMRKRWGWTLAVAIFVLNAVLDLAHAITGSGEWTQAAIGVPIVALILWWLTRPNVRALFA